MKKIGFILPDGSGFFKATVPTPKTTTYEPMKLEQLLRAISNGELEFTCQVKNQCLTIKDGKITVTCEQSKIEISFPKPR